MPESPDQAIFVVTDRLITLFLVYAHRAIKGESSASKFLCYVLCITFPPQVASYFKPIGYPHCGNFYQMDVHCVFLPCMHAQEVK